MKKKVAKPKVVKKKSKGRKTYSFEAVIKLSKAAAEKGKYVFFSCNEGADWLHWSHQGDYVVDRYDNDYEFNGAEVIERADGCVEATAKETCPYDALDQALNYADQNDVDGIDLYMGSAYEHPWKRRSL